jgi:hypothetical protein
MRRKSRRQAASSTSLRTAFPLANTLALPPPIPQPRAREEGQASSPQNYQANQCPARGVPADVQVLSRAGLRDAPSLVLSESKSTLCLETFAFYPFQSAHSIPHGAQPVATKGYAEGTESQARVLFLGVVRGGGLGVRGVTTTLLFQAHAASSTRLNQRPVHGALTTTMGDAKLPT